jgi:hypothetical protein
MPPPRDRSRLWILLLAAPATLALLLWWARMVAAGAVGEQAVLERPEGEEVVLSLLEVISIEGPEDYVLGHGALRVPVRGPTEHLVVGSEVTVGGVVQQGHVRASWVEPAPGRPAKHLLGIVGLVLGLSLMTSVVRASPAGLVLRG